MKKCSVCGQMKDESEFYMNNQRHAPRSTCKKCFCKTRQERCKKNNKEYDKWLKTISRKCERCGENRQYMIDFHHTEPENKTLDVSDIRSRSWSVKRKIMIAQKEIAKCIQLCSNCHREFHHLERTQGFSLDDYI